jgi:hypothetical protein
LEDRGIHKRYSNIGISILIFLVLFVILSFTGSEQCGSALLLTYAFVPITLIYIYVVAKKYHDLLSALGSDLLSVEFISNYELKITSARHGEFYFDFRTGGESGHGYYRVWIVMDKKRRNKLQRHILWESPSWINRSLGLYRFPHPTVPLDLVARVNSLRRITVEGHKKAKLIVAILDDAPWQSESDDIIRTVEILEHIWAKL